MCTTEDSRYLPYTTKGDLKELINYAIDKVIDKNNKTEELKTKITSLEKENKKLDEIYSLMKKLLLSNKGGLSSYRPIKNTTKTECYNVLGKIQELLQTNRIGD